MFLIFLFLSTVDLFQHYLILIIIHCLNNYVKFTVFSVIIFTSNNKTFHLLTSKEQKILSIHQCKKTLFEITCNRWLWKIINNPSLCIRAPVIHAVLLSDQNQSYWRPKNKKIFIYTNRLATNSAFGKTWNILRTSKTIRPI
jgi:hypothetical protein